MPVPNAGDLRGATTDGIEPALGPADVVDRVGLTPPWVIELFMFIFALKYNLDGKIINSTDPCTNSTVEPNIPCQTLFDKLMNGLLATSVWKGFVLLNPMFNMMGLFIARALKELDGASVEGVLLLCMNRCVSLLPSGLLCELS